ncbi:MAG: hypothetical protein N5P05_001588 [Chroococcopsis gigantea SAG 12.99]|jgi:cellulose biosynthesis protein BcsQ|nr:hypothetical protein [Chroococcopsis gigantea SAG 12.99]
MDCSPIEQALMNLPVAATESIVSNIFISALIQTLGFDLMETIPGYVTGGGGTAVDYALRKNSGTDIFIKTKLNPYLLIEVKGRNINLDQGSAYYKSTVNQLKYYLLDSNCHSAGWGIIANGDSIQLFRKQGKVIYPATPCLPTRPDNIDQLVSLIKEKIDNPSRALTVAVYNNKGGVGKTTTTINLAGVFSILGRKTLIVDFDHNQQDLSRSSGQPVSDEDVFSWLVDDTTKDIPVHLIKTFRYSPKTNTVWSFDVIPSDRELHELTEADLSKHFNSRRLKKALEPLTSKYDYILIDSAPNWRLFSQSALYAADVVLIPTKHNSIYSLDNAATVIKEFIPKVQEVRKDGGPIALPIFYNGESITDASKHNAEQAIKNILTKAKTDPINPFDLVAYFFPKFTATKKNFEIYSLPGFAHIANAAFSQIPAVYKHKSLFIK